MPDDPASDDGDFHRRTLPDRTALVLVEAVRAVDGAVAIVITGRGAAGGVPGHEARGR